jgi:hypothetical protein
MSTGSIHDPLRLGVTVVEYDEFGVKQKLVTTTKTIGSGAVVCLQQDLPSRVTWVVFKPLKVSFGFSQPYHAGMVFKVQFGT